MAKAIIKKAKAINKKVLIADDDESLLNVFVDSFAMEGFKEFGAANGQEALDIAINERPDIILLDLEMPIMGGLEMLENLRQDDWGRNALVIILTNYDDAIKVAMAAEKGAFDYLVKKDWKTKDVVAKVKNKLGLVAEA